MLRQRQSSRRFWVYCAASFLFGTLLSYVLLGRTTARGGAWDESDGSLQHFLPGKARDGSALSRAGSITDDKPRKKLLAIVGVQTGFTRPGAPKAYNYRLRRDALRKTWFPSSQKEADALEQKTGMMMRFVIGHSEDARQEHAMGQEIHENGAFLRLPIKEAYLSLTSKTLVFLQHVTSDYEADYIIKVDDDVYLRVDRLPIVIAQWKESRADYVGCMKTGGVMRDPGLRWYEPQHALIGGSSYFTHAWGSIYVLSDHAARTLATISATVPHGLRFFNNEDVTVGGWMLAMNVTHLDDRRLCEERCGPATVAVYDIPACAGLCDAPKSLPLLHAAPECRTPSLDPKLGTLPQLRPYFWFKQAPKE